MCLVIDTKKYKMEENEPFDSIPNITTKDIIVYKKLCSDNTPLSYSHLFNKYIRLKHNKKVTLGIYNDCIEEGYHSWKNIINKQLYTTFPRFANSLFIIPKNTLYFEGLENRVNPGYVSETIIYLGRIWNPITYILLLCYKLKNIKK